MKILTMKHWINNNLRWAIASLVCCLALTLHAQTDSIVNEEKNEVDVKEIVFGHILDSYEWHITKLGKEEIIIPLPIIVRSQTTG